MHRELVPIYGPFRINSFGVFIVIGLLVFSFLLLKDPRRKKLITVDQYYNILSLAIIVALIGGRFLYIITNWHLLDAWWEIFAIWQGGFSLLGGILALLFFMPIYFKKSGIPALQFLDLAATYAPLLQSISRIGCFFAGCCFGIATNLPFGIMNSHCNHAMHPTQLYSAITLFIIFVIMFCIAQYKARYPGQLVCIYLFLISVERFTVDFWRADREFVSSISAFSIVQLIAAAIAMGALITFAYINLLHKPHRS
jgi:phosphatidylglycerol---prolipoprotein diacylglyceryl transferase